MIEYPKVLYRSSPDGEPYFGGIATPFIIRLVADADEETGAKDDGWLNAEDAIDSARHPLDHDGDGRKGGSLPKNADIAAALAMLDPDDDEHWTAAGLPAVEMVAELTGEKVTRAMITAADPDAKRPE